MSYMYKKDIKTKHKFTLLLLIIVGQRLFIFNWSHISPYFSTIVMIFSRYDATGRTTPRINCRKLMQIKFIFLFLHHTFIVIKCITDFL